MRSACAARRRDPPGRPGHHGLDVQLPDERGPHGEPTRAEFAASDLLEIVEAFAELWDQLPMTIPGRPDYRTLVSRGRLVYAVAVRGQLSPVDGAVELIAIAVDLAGPEAGLEDPEGEHD